MKKPTLLGPLAVPAVSKLCSVLLTLCLAVSASHIGAQAVEQPATAGASDMPSMSAAAVVAQVNSVAKVDRLTRKILFRTTDKRGRVRERQTLSFRRHFGDERRLSLFFTAPANIRDTAVLTLDYPNTTDDDQWLYLPALRRVRRVPSADRGDDFLGTDFSYEDMKLDGSLSEEDYDYALSTDAPPQTYRLTAIPKTDDIAKELGYSRNDILVDAQSWVVREVAFWDLDDEAFKTLSVSDVRMVNGIPTRHRVLMRNHQTGHSTELVISEVDYDSAIDEAMFTQQALKRGL